MKAPAERALGPALALALALLTFVQFPGHTYLQQDSQIYVPILEHLRDPAVLANDMLARQPHVAFTLYDEAARFGRALTGLGFREVLQGEQIAARALGVWGLYLIAAALGLSGGYAWLVAVIASLGATITGPAVLTIEYEPTPRALALPLVICAIGLVGHRRTAAASLAGAAALWLHPPTALPFWLVFLAVTATAPWKTQWGADPRSAGPKGTPPPVGPSAGGPTWESGAPSGPGRGGPEGTPPHVASSLSLVAHRGPWGAPWPVIRRDRKGAIVLASFLAALAILFAVARAQALPGESQEFVSRIDPGWEQLERFRAAYNWVSTWPAALIAHWLILLALALAAYARVDRKAEVGHALACPEPALAASARMDRKAPAELRAFLAGLPILGVLTIPASWLLLERGKWALVPQIQPLRLLLFVALALQILAAVAGCHAALRKARVEAVCWFALAYLLSLEPVVTGPLDPARLALALALAAGTVLARQFAPAVALAAFFAIPALGGVVNYPHLHTPELAQLSDWARAHTAQDAVFLFPDAGHGLDPGIFRSEALRAVYVDWKAGGQVNFFRAFAAEWWSRWQQTVARGFQPGDMERYGALGIGYVVLDAAHRPARPAAFENRRYAVYRIQ